MSTPTRCHLYSLPTVLSVSCLKFLSDKDIANFSVTSKQNKNLKYETQLTKVLCIREPKFAVAPDRSFNAYWLLRKDDYETELSWKRWRQAENFKSVLDVGAVVMMWWGLYDTLQAVGGAESTYFNTNSTFMHFSTLCCVYYVAAKCLTEIETLKYKFFRASYEFRRVYGFEETRFLSFILLRKFYIPLHAPISFIALGYFCGVSRKFVGSQCVYLLNATISSSRLGEILGKCIKSSHVAFKNSSLMMQEVRSGRLVGRAVNLVKNAILAIPVPDAVRTMWAFRTRFG